MIRLVVLIQYQYVFHVTGELHTLICIALSTSKHKANTRLRIVLDLANKKGATEKEGKKSSYPRIRTAMIHD